MASLASAMRMRGERRQLRAAIMAMAFMLQQLATVPVAAPAHAARHSTGSLSFSAPVVLARGCYEPPKKPGGVRRSSCTSDAVFGLDVVGKDLIAGPNGTLVRSRDGGVSWQPFAQRPVSNHLKGHAYFWNARPGELWEQYATQAGAPTGPLTELNSSSHPAFWRRDGEVLSVEMHNRTSFTGFPRPVCYFYMYGCTNFVKVGGTYFTIKAVVFADEDHDQHSAHACKQTRGGQLGLQLGKPAAGLGGPIGGLNLSTVLVNSTDGLTWRYMSTVMDSRDYPDSAEGPNEVRSITHPTLSLDPVCVCSYFEPLAPD